MVDHVEMLLTLKQEINTIHDAFKGMVLKQRTHLDMDEARGTRSTLPNSRVEENRKLHAVPVSRPASLAHAKHQPRRFPANPKQNPRIPSLPPTKMEGREPSTLLLRPLRLVNQHWPSMQAH